MSVWPIDANLATLLQARIRAERTTLALYPDTVPGTPEHQKLVEQAIQDDLEDIMSGYRTVPQD